MAQNEYRLYPNTDLQQGAIPLDILLSKGCIRKAFSVTASNGHELPDDIELLVLHGDELYGCFIQLDGNAVVPADLVENCHYVPSGCVKVIDVNGAAEFGVISAGSNSGVLIVECVYAYQDTRKLGQITNI